MKSIEFKLESWTLNQVFNRIKNCRVVKPPYEKDGYYSNDFFLDKRLWLEVYYNWAWKKFLDYTIIKWREYYLYREWTKHYIWTFNGNSFVNITPNWFVVDNNSPIKFVYGKWIYWNKQSSWTVTNEQIWMWWDIQWSLIPWYAWWYVKFSYTWTSGISVWDFIVFKTWVLKWWINRVEHVEWWYVYIIWTNIRWSLPWPWTQFDVYKSNDTEYWTTLLVWHTQWVDLVILNWYNEANVIRVLTTSSEPIIDLVNFDWNIFALTETHMYFSRSTFDDNTQFYPLDYYYIDWWYKLFSIWKALLVFGRQNKLFAAANSTTANVWYVWYDVNYNWNLYSKYSCIFTDQTIYILQSNKQLKQIDIVQNNSTTFDLKVSDVLFNTRWLFNELDWWEVFITSNQDYLSFLYIKDWKTINFQYNKAYQHFIENFYNVEIYWFYDKILSNWKLYIENWYTDDWEEYEQEINMLVDTWFSIYKPYIIRTIFWLTNNLFDVNLNIELELWAKIIKINKRLRWFDFDNRLSQSLTWDELLEDNNNLEQNEYDWNIVSIQSNLMKAWRFIRIKYFSNKRFMIGNSYIIADETKTFINEPLFTN